MKGYFSLKKILLLVWVIQQQSSSLCSDEVFLVCLSIIYCIVLSHMALWTS